MRRGVLREESPERDLREEKNLSFIGAVVSGCKDSWGAGVFAESVFIVRPGDRGDGKIGEIKETGAPRVPS